MLIDCPTCDGTGREDLPRLHFRHGRSCDQGTTVCADCEGYGRISLGFADPVCMQRTGDYSEQRSRMLERRRERRRHHRAHAQRRQENAAVCESAVVERSNHARRDDDSRVQQQAAEAREAVGDRWAERDNATAERRHQWLEKKRAKDETARENATPNTAQHDRLLLTQDQMRGEMARRRLLRDVGVPFSEWSRCRTFTEAVIYCQAYHDQKQESKP